MNFLRRFMVGRYGADQLSIALFGLYFVLTLLRYFFLSPLFSMLVLLPLIVCFYRMLSRDIFKRSEENRRFMLKAQPVISCFQTLISQTKDRNHRYYKCPQCRQTLRVPKGRGKIEIRCVKCGSRFIKRT